MMRLLGKTALVVTQRWPCFYPYQLIGMSSSRKASMLCSTLPGPAACHLRRCSAQSSKGARRASFFSEHDLSTSGSPSAKHAQPSTQHSSLQDIVHSAQSSVHHFQRHYRGYQWKHYLRDARGLDEVMSRLKHARTVDPKFYTACMEETKNIMKRGVMPTDLCGIIQLMNWRAMSDLTKDREILELIARSAVQCLNEGRYLPKDLGRFLEHFSGHVVIHRSNRNSSDGWSELQVFVDHVFANRDNLEFYTIAAGLVGASRISGLSVVPLMSYVETTCAEKLPALKSRELEYLAEACCRTGHLSDKGSELSKQIFREYGKRIRTLMPRCCEPILSSFSYREPPVSREELVSVLQKVDEYLSRHMDKLKDKAVCRLANSFRAFFYECKHIDFRAELLKRLHAIPQNHAHALFQYAAQCGQVDGFLLERVSEYVLQQLRSFSSLEIRLWMAVLATDQVRHLPPAKHLSLSMIGGLPPYYKSSTNDFARICLHLVNLQAVPHCLPIFVELVNRCLQDFQNLSPRSVSNLLLAVARSKIEQFLPEVYAAVQHSSPNSMVFSINDSYMASQALAELRLTDEHWLKAIAVQLEKSMEMMKSKPHNLLAIQGYFATTLRCFSQVRGRAVEFFERLDPLLSIVLLTFPADFLYNGNMVDILWACAVHGEHPEEMLCKLLNCAPEQASAFQSQPLVCQRLLQLNIIAKTELGLEGLSPETLQVICREGRGGHHCGSQFSARVLEALLAACPPETVRSPFLTADLCRVDAALLIRNGLERWPGHLSKDLAAEDVVQLKAQGLTPLAVVAFDPTYFTINTGEPLGTAVMLTRSLRAAGWTVVEVRDVGGDLTSHLYNLLKSYIVS